MNDRVAEMMCEVVAVEYHKQMDIMLEKLPKDPHPEEEAPLLELSSRYYDLNRSIRAWRAEDVRQWCQRVMDPNTFAGFVNWYLVQKEAAPKVLAVLNKYFY